MGKKDKYPKIPGTFEVLINKQLKNSRTEFAKPIISIRSSKKKKKIDYTTIKNTMPQNWSQKPKHHQQLKKKKHEQRRRNDKLAAARFKSNRKTKMGGRIKTDLKICIEPRKKNPIRIEESVEIKKSKSAHVPNSEEQSRDLVTTRV